MPPVLPLNNADKRALSRPGSQYGAIAKIVLGATSRGLRMIAYEEERRSRDEVLLAMGALRKKLIESGLEVPLPVVADVFFDITGRPMDSNFYRACADAEQRRRTRVERTRVLDAMDGFDFGEMLEERLTTEESERDGK